MVLLFTIIVAEAQQTYPVNGVRDSRNTIYAFIHAEITTAPGSNLKDATLMIQNGEIIAVGTKVSIPPNAVVTDLSGYHIYPSFIELVSDNGIPDKPKMENDDRPQFVTKDNRAVSWNQAVTPEFNAAEHYSTDTAANNTYRKMGFGAALVHRQDGIIRGTGSVVLLTDNRANENLLKDVATLHYSFRKGSSRQDYPSSQMGAIALLRQTMYDAVWYQNGGDEIEYNISLKAINNNKQLPAFFHVGNPLEVLRAAEWGKEFGILPIIEGDGKEYQKAEAIKDAGVTMIVPLNFPKPFDVENPWDADMVALKDLKHWELAPANTSILYQQNIKFAITSNKIDKKDAFLSNLSKAVQYGLPDSAALAALTTVPAMLTGVASELGTLEKGKKANFIICSKKVFDKNNIIYENWVEGNQYVLKQRSSTDLRGAWSLKIDSVTYGLLLTGEPEKLKYSILKNTDTLKASGSVSSNNINIVFKDGEDQYRLSGIYEGRVMSGAGKLNRRNVRWSASYENVYAEKAIEEKTDTISIGKIWHPFTAYGWEEEPKQQQYLIKNTTVWTNTDAGILENKDVLLENGKIKKVGDDINIKNAVVIDGTGKHLTSGIIDEHSHIAISSGVNEGTQAVTAEVRIGDVINSEDVNIYRQLAGGVTTSQLLHGSANPIGGQSALIKLRWGSSPEAMKFEGADGFIKFALGENVKQSNWGDKNRVRFPQTRMGVEQVMMDAFSRAQSYNQALSRSDTLVRKDLELDALVEILQSERFVTCHSYVQSEINMLMKLAESFGFTLNTFTHILEGYKVADKMFEHGAGGSTFSDWWAYKYEVRDAIPYNAALMTKMGVVTAINSDDAEMARRLNQEAAKAVKYGGLTEEEAWKLVTLNPAKLLHIDDKVGSVAEGKDADVVLWSDNPLSIYSRAEKTFVDGVLYFDIDADQMLQQQVIEERERLISTMIQAKQSGSETKQVMVIMEPEYECDTMEDFISE